jgi:chromosome partitioning protein
MIIATTNSKGGVGKSTIAVHLAVYLQRIGKRVLVIDCDMQRSCSRWLDRMGSGLLTERITDPDEVYEHAPKFAQEVDIVVADGPAGTDELTRALLMVCDLALVPCGPSPLDLEASQLAVRVIRQARVIRKGDLPRALFVPNKLQANTILSAQLLEAPAALGIPAVQNPLKYRQVYAVAAGQGQVVWQIEGAPGEAVGNMELLCQEILDYAVRS